MTDKEKSFTDDEKLGSVEVKTRILTNSAEALLIALRQNEWQNSLLQVTAIENVNLFLSSLPAIVDKIDLAQINFIVDIFVPIIITKIELGSEESAIDMLAVFDEFVKDRLELVGLTVNGKTRVMIEDQVDGVMVTPLRTVESVNGITDVQKDVADEVKVTITE